MKLDEIHLHCETCFKPSKCEYQSVCALVKCPNSCNRDIKFHECKLNEHLSEICANRYTKCVNYNYGCKLQLKYNQLVEHLGKCPANIHVCPSKRLRKLIKQNDNNTNFKWMDPITQLKEQFTYYPKQNQLCITDVLHNIDTNEFIKNQNDCDTYLSKSFFSFEIVETFLEFCFMGFKDAFKDYPYRYKSDNSDSFAVFERKCDILLKSNNEYYEHLKIFHNFIEYEVHDHLDQCCPYAVYGCDYYFRKIDFYYDQHKRKKCELKVLNDNNLVFNCSHGEIIKSNVDSVDYFSKLPLEISNVILSYLNPSSLKTLSLTSKHMNEVCKRRLHIQGIVYPKWKKLDGSQSNKWLCEFYWSFGKCIQTPQHIEYKLPDEAYHKHVQNCPYRVLNENKFEKINSFSYYTNSTK